MEFLTQIKSLIEKRILEEKYKFNFKEEPKKKSIFFEIESDKNIYTLTFWENKTGEITKIDKSTDEMSCEVIEDIEIDGINKILDKQFTCDSYNSGKPQ